MPEGLGDLKWQLSASPKLTLSDKSAVKLIAMFAFRRLPIFGPPHRRLVHDGMSWKPKDKDKLAKMILDSANSPAANMQAAKDTLLFRYEDPVSFLTAQI